MTVLIVGGAALCLLRTLFVLDIVAGESSLCVVDEPGSVIVGHETRTESMDKCSDVAEWEGNGKGERQKGSGTFRFASSNAGVAPTEIVLLLHVASIATWRDLAWSSTAPLLHQRAPSRNSTIFKQRPQ